LPTSSPWFPLALVLRGVVSTLRADSDQVDASFAAAAEAAERLGAIDVLILATGERSVLSEAAGEHQSAEELAREGRTLMGGEEYPLATIVHAAAVRASLRCGHWGEARDELTAAEASLPGLTYALPWLAVQTRLALARAYLTLRDASGASRKLDEIEDVLGRRPRLGVLADEARELRREVAALNDAMPGPSSALTAAELRLIPLLATHLSFREIGERLYVSRNTVKTQAISLYRKLGVSSRSDAIARASELGLVDVDTRPLEDLIRTG
jgi:LuxR family maltose regulon positive regulatory protein